MKYSHFALVWLVSSVLGVANASSRIEIISSQLNAIFQCPQRVWPGLKKDSFRIVYAQPSAGKAWLWTGVDGRHKAISTNEFPISVQMPKYAFGQFRNDRAVIINLDEVSERPRIPGVPIDSAVNLGFHEGFHFLFQMKEPWVSQYSGVDRRPNIDHVSAVYYRKMLIRSLRDDLLANRGFGHSAYWFRKWEALGEAPETKFSDILEGTANYAEIIASIVSARGCGVSEAEIFQKITADLNRLVDLPLNVNMMKELFAQYKSSGYQIQGYEIGLLSLLALRARGVMAGELQYPMGRDFMAEINKASSVSEKMSVMTDMQSALSKIQTPAELLLREIAPISSADDSDLSALIKQASQ